MRRARRCGIGLALGVLALALWASAAGAATIKGRVIDEAGEPIAGIAVCAKAQEYVYPGGVCGWTGADGRYAIEGVSEASFYISFFAESPGQNYAPQWYGGAAHPEESPLVAATGGIIEGIDATMRLGGQIRGLVTDRVTGTPIAGAQVCARSLGQSPQGTITSCARTEAGGEYDVTGLGTAEYAVYFPTEFGPNYVRAEYPAKVTVAAGFVTAGIDAQLTPGLQIEGDVVDAATGKAPVGLLGPYAGLSACALDPATEARVQCVPIEASHYVLPGLPPGSYVIAFALDSFEAETGRDLLEDGYVRRYWHEVQNFGEATPVGSAVSTVISGIDATLTRGDEILPPTLPSIIQGPIHLAPDSPPDGLHAKPHVPKPKKIHCKKGFRRVTKSRHQRCVKIHRKKARRHPGRPKTSHR